MVFAAAVGGAFVHNHIDQRRGDFLCRLHTAVAAVALWLPVRAPALSLISSVNGVATLLRVRLSSPTLSTACHQRLLLHLLLCGPYRGLMP